MPTRRLIKYFRWREQDREQVVLGAGTRINPITHRAQLTALPNGAFPTTPNLFTRSRLTNPLAVRRWVGFEATALQKSNDLGQQVTNVGFRLSDGVTDRYWNGAAWVAAGLDQWSTEAQVAGNIAAFGAGARQLQVVANLSTTDARFTPELIELRVLYEASIDFQEDILYRSLVPALRQRLRPTSRFVFRMPATGNSLTLAQVALETGYEVVSIDSAFDLNADPDRLTDIVLAFNPATGVITLNQTLALGTDVWVEFVYVPVVAVTTSQDFADAERVPAVILADMAFVDAREAPNGEDFVANKAAETAVVVPSPLQGDLSFTVLFMADKAVDLQRLGQEIRAFFAAVQSLRSTGLDERYRLQLDDEFAMVGELGQKEIHVAQATFRIRHFRQWLKDAVDEPLVTRLRMQFPGEPTEFAVG